MSKENDNVEIFEDEEVITLEDENGNEVDFAEVACVELDGRFYVLLQPIDDVEGIEEDEVIICLVEPQDDETEMITPITDEALCERVFDEYLKAAADDTCTCEDCTGGDKDSGCDCGCQGKPAAKDTKKAETKPKTDSKKKEPAKKK